MNKSPLTIKVIGIGSGGNVAVSHMSSEGIRGAEFINLDMNAQFLKLYGTNEKVLIEDKTSVNDGDLSMRNVLRAVDNSKERLYKLLRGADVVFVISAMGGTIGSAATPVVAEIAREVGAVRVGIVTSPLKSKFNERFLLAADRIAILKEKVNTLIVVSNNNLFGKMDDSATVADVFRTIDDIFTQGVRMISSTLLFSVTGFVPGAYTDIKSYAGNYSYEQVSGVIKDAGLALLGVGRAEGRGRSIQAAEKAINNLFLDNRKINPSHILVDVMRGEEAAIVDLGGIIERIRKSICGNAEILYSETVLNENMRGEIIVTIMVDKVGTPA